MDNWTKLSDLMCYDGLYYIGDLIDTDGMDWVEPETALQILNELGV